MVRVSLVRGLLKFAHFFIALDMQSSRFGGIESGQLAVGTDYNLSLVFWSWGHIYSVLHIKCPHAQGAFSTIRSKHQWGRHTGLPLRHALILPLLHGIVRFRAKLLRRGEPMCSPFLFFDFRLFILQTGISTRMQQMTARIAQPFNPSNVPGLVLCINPRAMPPITTEQPSNFTALGASLRIK